MYVVYLSNDALLRFPHLCSYNAKFVHNLSLIVFSLRLWAIPKRGPNMTTLGQPAVRHSSGMSTQVTSLVKGLTDSPSVLVVDDHLQMFTSCGSL